MDDSTAPSYTQENQKGQTKGKKEIPKDSFAEIPKQSLLGTAT